MEVARWGGHTFEVSPEVIRSFDKLTVKGGSDTDDKIQSKQKYLTRKNGKPTEVGMNVVLNAFTGADVRSEAMAFVDEAQKGKSDWIYVGGEKLVPCQLMLTEAAVEEIAITPGGVWTRASVKLTFKQSDLGDEKIKKKPAKTTGGGDADTFADAAMQGIEDILDDAQTVYNALSGKPITARQYIKQKGNEITQAMAEQAAAKEKGKKGGGAAAGKISYKGME